MAASLDGFIARRDGAVDWLDTRDEFAAGKPMDAAAAGAFLASIGCYVMGSRTYETALRFEERGFGWAYGDTPTIVLTRRELPRRRQTVEIFAGDLHELVEQRLRPTYRSAWIVGGAMVAGEFLRLGLADELRYSIVPALIGHGIPFFDRLDADVRLHLLEVDAYENGVVDLRYQVQKGPPAESPRSLQPPPNG